MKTILLLSPKIKSFKNSINLKALLKRLPFIGIGLIFWLIFYIGSYEVLNFIRSLQFLGEILSQKLLSVAFFSLCIFLLLSTIITALSSLYISKDIPFLMSKPIEVKEILRMKTVETIVSSSWMVISFMPPLFIAYGVSYGAPLYFYLFFILLFIPFLLIPGGIGILIAHVLTKIFPVKKARLAVLATGLLLFLSIYLVVRFQWSITPRNLENFIRTFLALKTDSPLLPSLWMTESVMALLKRQIPDVLYLLLILSNGLFMLMVSDVIGHKLYIDNLERIQPGSRYLLPVTRYNSFYPGRNGAVLWKDIKVFFRDAGQWTQLFIIGALILIYVYNFRAIPLKELSVEFSPFITELVGLLNMVLAGLVLTAVSARFLYSSISLEGRAFWIMKTSPLKANRLLWSKFLYGFIPVAIIMVGTVLITNMIVGVDHLLMTLSVTTILLLCISISGLGTGMGAIYPQFRYDNIASISMGPSGMLFMIIAFSIVLLTLFAEAWSFYLYKKAVVSGLPLHLWEKAQMTLAGVFILILNGLAFYIPMKLGERSLSGDFNV
jgi:ABC-2 type transport system permease protein